MPTTYEPIASINGTGSSGTITFSGIPSTYTDLRVVLYSTTTSTLTLLVRLNGDTGSNFSTTQLYGDGSGAYTGRNTNESSIQAAFFGTSGPNVLMLDVMSYANTNINKTVLCAGTAPSRIVNRHVGLWRSTAAVNSISLISSANFPTTSTVSLYGIKAA